MNDATETRSYPFTKMEGLGNDFIIMDDLACTTSFSADEVRNLCDRHFGIGADGLILLRPATEDEADFSWLFYNADGSIAEMCGNGIRCIGAYACEQGLVGAEQSRLRIQTDVGIRTINILRDEDGDFQAAEVDMGQACILEESYSPLFDQKAGTGWEFFCVSMGNPHAVAFVDNVDNAPVDIVGPRVEHDPHFSAGTNVEFAAVLDRATLDLRVWERGVGETLACGTGACATAVAAWCKGRCDERLTVRVPGGTLQIAIDPATLQVMMTGPARTVFVGTITR